MRAAHNVLTGFERRDGLNSLGEKGGKKNPTVFRIHGVKSFEFTRARVPPLFQFVEISATKGAEWRKNCARRMKSFHMAYPVKNYASHLRTYTLHLVDTHFAIRNDRQITQVERDGRSSGVLGSTCFFYELLHFCN